MKVLFPINEALGVYKIGGLGDVGAALPKQLTTMGHDIRLALPRHPEIELRNGNYALIDSYPISYDDERLQVRVYQGYLPSSNVPLYLFDEVVYLSQHTDASDNHADKYAVFSLAVATWLGTKGSWKPDVVHLHDWHTALIPLIARHIVEVGQPLRYILTIHNLAYQGATKTAVAKKLGLKPAQCRVLDWDTSDGDTNILLEGILHVDEVTTVSPRYAEEILTSEYGEKLETFLGQKKSHLHGILNGLDQAAFNPLHDTHLHAQYSVEDAKVGKSKNKQALFDTLGWKFEPSSTPTLIGFVGRVDAHQKGVQHIIEALNRNALTSDEVYFAFLGTGDPELEKGLHQAASSQTHVSIMTRFDEAMARVIYAASDLMLIPSKFEPCGLVQLIAMRYGALPIARATGGLVNTIDHLSTGFLYEEYSAEAMLSMLDKALITIRDEAVLSTMRNAAMSYDSSWTASASQYDQLYRDVLILD